MKLINSLFKLGIGAMLFLPVLSSCSDDEDTTPSHADENLFKPADDDNSPTAQLRRQFFNDTKTFLLFTDTLRHEANGTDAYGKTIWNDELLDVTYTVIGSASSSHYTYSYITDFNKRKQAAELVRDKLMRRLGDAVPYSVLIVDSIMSWVNNNGYWELDKGTAWNPQDPYKQYILGTRAYVISTNGEDGFTDSTYFDGIMEKIILDKLGRLSDTQRAPFYAPVSSYMGPNHEIAGKSAMGYSNGYNMDNEARSLGFWQDYNYYYFAIRSGYDNADLELFTHAVLTYSEAEVEKMMEGYPIVIQRFKALRQIIKDMGIVLDK